MNSNQPSKVTSINHFSRVVNEFIAGLETDLEEGKIAGYEVKGINPRTKNADILFLQIKLLTIVYTNRLEKFT